MSYLRVKKTIVFTLIVSMCIFTGMMVTAIRTLPSWSFEDYDGNGFITQDEIERWYSELGVDREQFLKNPSYAAQMVEKLDKQYGETNTQSSSSATIKKEEHTHSYTAKVTKEATCTEAGEMTYTCSCGDSYTEVIAMKSHDYDSIVTKEPNCTETGTETKMCVDCGDTIESVIPALGHKPGDWTTEKEATCSEEGRNVRYCTVCGEPVETMMVDKLPHTEGEWEVSQRATLTKPGLRVIKCTECGEILQQEEIPANTTLLYVIIGVCVVALICIIAGVVIYKRRR
jgi:hypothetical protein